MRTIDREAAGALLRKLVGGENGLRLDHPIVRAVTEARVPGEGYSSCADLPHALRYLLGLRDRVNRVEAGNYQYGARTLGWLCERGRVGSVGHPCACVPRPGDRLGTGDTLLLEVGNAARTHACVVLEQTADELVTADYGQHPMRGQRPEDIACQVRRRALRVVGGRLHADGRPIDSWLPLEDELGWARSQGSLVDPLDLDAWLLRHAPTKPPAPGRLQRPTLRRGASGALVKALQVALGLKADGIFGPVTEAAVRAAQAEGGLVVDGVVGPKTWARVDALLALL